MPRALNSAGIFFLCALLIPSGVSFAIVVQKRAASKAPASPAPLVPVPASIPTPGKPLISARSKVYADWFCEDPYRAICGTQNDDTVVRRYVQLESDILDAVRSSGAYPDGKLPDLFSAEEARKIAANRRGLAPSTHWTPYDLVQSKPKIPPEELPKTTPDDRFKEGLIYLRRVETELFKKMGLTTAQWKQSVAAVRASLLQAVRDDPGLRPAVRKEMVKILASVDIVPPAEFTEKYAQRLSQVYWALKYPQYLGDLFEVNGMMENAVYFRPVNAFTVFPGWFLDVALLNPTRTDLTSALQLVLGHEISHSIDSDAMRATPVGKVEGDPYAALQACVQSYWKSEIPLVGKKYFRHLTFQADLSTLAKWMPEIVADYWSTSAMALRFLHRPIQPEKAMGILRREFAPLCQNPERAGADSDHPGARMRASLIIGRNPILRKVLGCRPNSPQQPYCSTSGPVY